MRNRYRVVGNWTADGEGAGPFLVQSADLLDTTNDRIYTDGAKRVIDSRTGKPAKVGKGGTVPFKGEMAWADARRLAVDLYWKDRNTS